MTKIIIIICAAIVYVLLAFAFGIGAYRTLTIQERSRAAALFIGLLWPVILLLYLVLWIFIKITRR